MHGGNLIPINCFDTKIFLFLFLTRYSNFSCILGLLSDVFLALQFCSQNSVFSETVVSGGEGNFIYLTFGACFFLFLLLYKTRERWSFE